MHYSLHKIVEDLYTFSTPKSVYGDEHSCLPKKLQEQFPVFLSL